MKNFKNYLQTQLNIIEIKLKGIITEIENIPDPSNINITIYGNKESIYKEYKRKVKVSLFKKIIGPSSYELKEYIRNRELNKLNKLKTKYENQISQIKSAINSINEQGIAPIHPSNEIIILLLRYISTHNINPKESLKYLIQICSIPEDKTSMEDKMKRNLISFFDNEGTIDKKAKLSTVYLILDKLFSSVLTEEEQTEYKIAIDQLYVQIKYDKEKQTKAETKPELELQRRALIELQDYINGTTIIKSLDIKNFKLLLDTAKIDKEIQERLLIQMEHKIMEENRILERNQTIEAMKIFLSEEDIELIKQAEIKENTLMGPLKDLVSRAKKDVISMCRYLSMFEQVGDIHESLEILNDRTRVLKHVLLNIEEEQKETNTLFYVTDKEGVPIFLRNLELHQIGEYSKIYNLLYKAATNTKGKRYTSKDSIDFYYIGQGNIKIVYADIKGIRIIVGIDSINPTYTIKNNITPEIIEKINEIEQHSFYPTFKDIHSTYENVILEALNLREVGYTLTLKKKED